MKTATLITGASGGIGLELAKVYAARGHNLILIARNAIKLKELKTAIQDKFDIEIVVIVKDLAKAEAAAEIFDEIETMNISVTCLINNAGFGDYSLFHESDPIKMEEMMQLNMISLTKLTRLFVSKMITHRKGKILNIASVASFHSGPLMSVYFATKAFVLHLSEALHEELKPFGIAVTAFCPGPVRTGFVKRADLEKSSFFSSKLSDPAKIALQAYSALQKNKAVAIPGLKNQIQVFLIRCVPRLWARKLTHHLLSKKIENDREGLS